MVSEQQKKLGAFYTPEQVTDCLSAWAIRKCSDNILEPSFGGCNFLTSSVKILQELGTKTPYKNIFGFDIDPLAFKILEQKHLSGPNFVLGDFLESFLYDSIQVDVVIGNPPYLPIHKIQDGYKKILFNKFKKSEIKISKKSSLWIYFIVHSFRYLATGGRMAWVVPDSLTFTDYGKSFLEQLGRLFVSVKVVRIEERFFTEAGTKEKTSFLFCEGFRQGRCKHEEYNFKHLSEALLFTLQPTSSLLLPKKITIRESLFLQKNYKLSTLGNLFDIKIGIVIGATNLLVFTENDAKNTPFHPNYTYPIITKGKQIEGLQIDRKQLCIRGANQPLYIINGTKLELEDSVLFEKLINTIPNKVLLNQTFRKRSKLFGYDDYNHPDAFLTFFAQRLPKFVVNKERELNCTNSVHRLYLKEGCDQIMLKFIAIQFFSDYFSNEILSIARPYGNSIHKFEPSDASKIPIIIPIKINKLLRDKIDSCVDVIESYINDNNINKAKKAAYDFIEKLSL